MEDEKVLVFGEEHLSRVMTCPVGRLHYQIIGLPSRQFMPRCEAEDNPAYKQIIPYNILRMSHDGTKFYLVYSRGSKSGETRLIGKKSIGIGGHINPCDAHGDLSMFDECSRREIFEEVGIDISDIASRLYPIGKIYDSSNSVGLVHFGVITIVDIPKDYLVFRNGQWKLKTKISTEIQDHAFQSKEWLDNAVGLETWSEIAKKYLE